ncbi:S-adenosylmethionine uptake transporter [Litoreibacter meonggei]|uniref:S-adenosylmethionine uptake transporter n=1 Tax=Litoreibacter meonggei TaxID=1049199 RepID=A0A497WQB9_9RHOB|nr:DMT family transporter [Litoreibacter meonggei]RLJ58991.1 S-adenosylmethionine uptake transporter [Litoreibacter meonggei]
MPIPTATPITVKPLKPHGDSTRGIAYMAGGMFLFSAVDTQAKFLTDSLHPVQIVWSRQLGLFLGVLILIALRGVSVLHTRKPLLQIGRGVLAATSATLFIVAVSYVPLADAVAVSFVAPFIVTLMGALILREPVGIRRWVAVVIGFAGTLIVMRPGMGVLHPAVGLVLVAAAAFACRQVLSRALSGADPVQTTVAYTAIVGSALLTIPLPFVWQTPQMGLEMVLLVSIALMAAVAEVLVIKALEVAQAVVVAPVMYSLLIWGTFYGWIVFGDLPDLWTWVGALIIVATGVYTLNRERLAAKRT